MSVTPLVLAPQFKSVVWGGQRIRETLGAAVPQGPVGEAWIASAHPFAESRVASGPHAGRRLAEVVAADPVAWMGRQPAAETGPEFPLLLKIIDAGQDLSIQVHPDVAAARATGDVARAKTECWWVLDATPDACLYLGLREEVTEEALREAIPQGSLADHVHKYPVAPGDCFFVPAGAVHAIGGGVLLLEIQETSDTTYRLHDWGRVDADGQSRDLHVESGLCAARARPRSAGPVRPEPDPDLVGYRREILVRCPEFTLERLAFDDFAAGRTDGQRFHVAVVLSGCVRLECGGAVHGPLNPWSSVVLPAALGDYRFVAEGGPATMALAAPGAGQLLIPEAHRERLHKVLAAAGVGSRRECERMIADGRVAVDGVVVDRMGVKVDSEAQDIRVDGERVMRPETKVYYLLNKPKGVVCTNHDEEGRLRAIDLINERSRRIYTIGRLDVDSEGAILLTNDGELAFRVSHPRFGMPKTYLVQVRGRLVAADLERIEKGVWLADGKVEGFQASIRRVQQSSTWLRVVLREGRNREIRRVFARVGFPVKSLKRVRIGNLDLRGLLPGTWRTVSEKEVSSLIRVAESELRPLDDAVDDGFLPRLARRRPGTSRPRTQGRTSARGDSPTRRGVGRAESERERRVSARRGVEPGQPRASRASLAPGKSRAPAAGLSRKPAPSKPKGKPGGYSSSRPGASAPSRPKGKPGGRPASSSRGPTGSRSKPRPGGRAPGRSKSPAPSKSRGPAKKRGKSR